MDSMPLPIRIIAPRFYLGTRWTPTPHVPPGGGHGHRQGRHHGRSEGHPHTVVEQLYGKGTKTRFRPHHFPSPSRPARWTCSATSAAAWAAPTCKGEGWIELLGAGMIHPRVLEMAGIDPSVYSGWAFGIGLERTHAALQNRRSAADFLKTTSGSWSSSEPPQGRACVCARTA